MVVCQTGAVLSAPYCKRSFAVFRVVRIEVFLQIPNHLLAWVTVDPQERVVIGNTIDALANGLLVESIRTILPREGLDSLLFLLDVPLNLTA